MNAKRRMQGVWPLLAGVVIGLVLQGWGQAASAKPAPNPSQTPFASAIEQRADLLAELRKLNRQVAEQTQFLKSGKLKVVIELRDERPRDRP